MNTKQQAAYVSQVKHTLQGLEHTAPGLCPGCDECGLEGVVSMDDLRYQEACDYEGEGFSRSSCDSCGTCEGGSRHAAHAWPTGADRTATPATYVHLDICSDCLLFHANGDLPEEL